MYEIVVFVYFVSFVCSHIYYICLLTSNIKLISQVVPADIRHQKLQALITRACRNVKKTENSAPLAMRIFTARLQNQTGATPTTNRPAMLAVTT